MTTKEKPTSKESDTPKTIEGGSGATIPEDAVCQKAPEWAEHSRLHDDDQPCDDGRLGNLERNEDDKDDGQKA